MTPMLILLFGVNPSTAISSDLVAAVVMRPFGAACTPQGTVNLRLVGWMVMGSSRWLSRCVSPPPDGPVQCRSGQTWSGHSAQPF